MIFENILELHALTPAQFPYSQYDVLQKTSTEKFKKQFQYLSIVEEILQSPNVFM